METKFKIKQHVWCTNERHKSEVGVIAEVAEVNALVKTKDGERKENLYCVMLHYPNGKMYFEEFFESELELVQQSKK